MYLIGYSIELKLTISWEYILFCFYTGPLKTRSNYYGRLRDRLRQPCLSFLTGESDLCHPAKPLVYGFEVQIWGVYTTRWLMFSTSIVAYILAGVVHIRVRLTTY